MSTKPTRQFTPAQKAEAVRIVTQSGKSISQIAKEMGLTESALRNWVKQALLRALPAERLQRLRLWNGLRYSIIGSVFTRR